MKKIYVLLMVLFLVKCAMGQSCLPDGIVFTSQSQIDNFAVNYPNCSQIEGWVYISGNNITNLDGLGNIISIGGELRILDNPSLLNIAGLSNLAFIGGQILLWENPFLNNLAGFDDLTHIGGTLEIGGNQSLISLDGLNLLTYLGGTFHLAGNPLLSNINALTGLTSISGALDFVGNSSLENLNGLNNLKTIGWYFFLLDNASLTSLAGLNNLTSVGEYFVIDNNDALTSLSGLDSLASIGQQLGIINNNSLIDIKDLETVTSIDGNITIYNNAVLPSLSGLENIDTASVWGLYIVSNNLLSYCETMTICEYIVNPNATIEIHDNVSGCNSQAEVEAACGVGLNESATYEYQINIYPNPSSDYITIETSANSYLYTLSIMNLHGQQEITRHITEPKTQIDISNLPSGVYMVKLVGEKGVQVGKVIKQ